MSEKSSLLSGVISQLNSEKKEREVRESQQVERLKTVLKPIASMCNDALSFVAKDLIKSGYVLTRIRDYEPGSVTLAEFHISHGTRVTHDLRVYYRDTEDCIYFGWSKRQPWPHQDEIVFRDEYSVAIDKFDQSHIINFIKAHLRDLL